MKTFYAITVFLHIGSASLWIGAMFFGDPNSTRFFSKLFERRLGGIGWYAQGMLWLTGIVILSFRGIGVSDLFSADLLSTTWGKALWIKILLIIMLAVFQVTSGNKPSKLLYGYMAGVFLAMAMGVLVARPHMF